eukprot:g30573.t1
MVQTCGLTSSDKGVGGGHTDVREACFCGAEQPWCASASSSAREVFSRSSCSSSMKRRAAPLRSGRGQTTACCGYWAQRAAANLQKFVVQQLHTDRRHLGDVHLDNITAVRGIRDEHSHWSSVAVLYLEDPGSTQVQLQRSSERHEVEVLPVARGSLVQVPEGAVLLHSEPLRVAWTRVRNAEAPPRDFFEFYLASWVQQTFVMPYDTTSQRRFFRKHTRHPRILGKAKRLVRLGQREQETPYWHGFLWSFVGTFCTVFPCLPLAWFGLQALARASKGEADSKDEGRRRSPGERP